MSQIVEIWSNRKIKMPLNIGFKLNRKIKCREIQKLLNKPIKLKCRENFMP